MKEGENPVLNRVDLITRTIKALDRMSRENDEFKALLAERSQEGSEIAAARQAIKDDRVSICHRHDAGVRIVRSPSH